MIFLASQFISYVYIHNTQLRSYDSVVCTHLILVQPSHISPTLLLAATNSLASACMLLYTSSSNLLDSCFDEVGLNAGLIALKNFSHSG